MLNISKDLFTAWNEAGVLYCHWKSNEHLLPGLDGTTDLDVLLSIDDKKRGEELLHKLDFLKCKSQYGSRYPGVEDWIGFDKTTGALIHLHLHFRLATGHKGMKEYSLPWSALALNSRICNEKYGVYIMDPNLELVTLYTRIGLKASFIEIIRCWTRKFNLEKDVQREIDWLKARIDWDKVCHLLDVFYGKNAAKVVVIMQKEKIAAGDYQTLRKIAEANFKKDSSITYFMRFKEISIYVYQKYLKGVIRKIHFLFSKKVPASGNGLTIAFLGQDGAGKTTITKELIKWWGWKMDVRYVYLGSGENYFSIKRSIVNKMPSRGVFKIVRFIIALTDVRDITKKAYRNICKAEKYASKGGVVIFDRFPQMKYPGICDGPKIRCKLNELFGNGFVARLLVPLANSEEKYIKRIIEYHPNMVFKLILPPEESIRRKPQESIEAVTKKHEIVKSLEFIGSVVYTIDATMPYNDEMVMIKNAIWQHIQK